MSPIARDRVDLDSGVRSLMLVCLLSRGADVHNLSGDSAVGRQIEVQYNVAV